jgi:hypothetical protein
MRAAWSVSGVVATTAVVVVGSDVFVDAQPAVDSRPYMALLCTYADNPNTYGIDAAHIERMFNGTPRSLDGLVQEMSLGRANLTGSRAAGWFSLGKPRSAYAANFAGFAEIITDCARAATAGGVDLSPFRHVAVFVNDQLAGAEAAVVPVALEVGGQQLPYNGMIVTRRGLTSPPLVLHELGHVFGGKHTRSVTDPLGGGATYGDRPERPVNGVPLRTVNIGPGWDASNRDAMGWVPADRKVTFAGGTQTVTLSRLTQPTPTGAMLVNVPIGTSQVRYVVSARTHTGYDSQTKFPNTLQFGYVVPTPGVVIEQVDPNLDTVTMFSTPGGDSSTAAAVWLPGQTFVDQANGISIRIDRFDDTGAQVTITGGGAAPATTAAPVTQPPATQPPATQPPATQPPATQPPATQPPATQPPATQPPATQPPATQPPAPAPAPGGSPTDELVAAPLVTAPTTLGPISTAGFATAADEPPPCAGIGATAWIRVQLPASGSLTVNTAGSSFDTVIATYRGPANATTVGSLAIAACVDDVPGSTQSAVTITGNPGELYYVQIGGYGQASGNLTVSVS